MNKLVTIAGGSGSGKSTVAIALRRRYPEWIALIQLDDYYKSAEAAPQLLSGGPNWDSPASVRFDDLVHDLDELLENRSVVVRSKSELYNPAYDPVLKNKIEVTIEPRPIIVLEGHLSLYDEKIRNRSNLSFFFNMPIEESVHLRGSSKFKAPAGYLESVLIPAHYAYVEPTRRHAEVVIQVADRSIERTVLLVEAIIRERFEAVI